MKLFKNLFLIVCLFGSAFTFASDLAQEMQMTESEFQAMALNEYNRAMALDLNQLENEDIDALYEYMNEIYTSLTPNSSGKLGYDLLIKKYPKVLNKINGVAGERANQMILKGALPGIIAVKIIEAKKAEREQAEE